MQIYAPLNSESHPELQRVEVASSFQLPGFHIIGLPAPEVSEAKERIRAAIESCGFELPKRRVVLNLAPASIRKRGTGLDLAMTLGVLNLAIPDSPNRRIAAWGEVGLDGSVKPAGQITRSVFAAWQGGMEKLLLPYDELSSAVRAMRWIRDAGFFPSPAPALVPVSSVREARKRLLDPSSILPLPQEYSKDEKPDPDAFSSLLPLPPSLERALGVSALGSHHILLLGPKGTGKSHALEWLIALQPKMPERMKVNHMLLLELSGTRSPAELSAPVRRVSPGVRASALIGSWGGGQIRPGEFSLAHGGILVADEFPEWSRDSREALREPLERGTITVTRAKSSTEFPARFSFAANGNLCPCGGWPAEFPLPLEADGQLGRVPKCRCTRGQRKHYISRMSGPILDRIDLVLLVGSSSVQKNAERTPERAGALKSKVLAARERAQESWGEIPGLLAPSAIERLLTRNPDWVSSLDRLQLSSLRARHKTVRVALSLTAWDGMSSPHGAHFIEASRYRPERFGLCE